jgi:hypothetical protein
VVSRLPPKNTRNARFALMWINLATVDDPGLGPEAAGATRSGRLLASMALSLPATLSRTIRIPRRAATLAGPVDVPIALPCHIGKDLIKIRGCRRGRKRLKGDARTDEDADGKRD